MKLKVYINNIYHGTVESELSEDGTFSIHIPETLTQCIGNKHFHIDLLEEG